MMCNCTGRLCILSLLSTCKTHQNSYVGLAAFPRSLAKSLRKAIAYKCNCLGLRLRSIVNRSQSQPESIAFASYIRHLRVDRLLGLLNCICPSAHDLWSRDHRSCRIGAPNKQQEHLTDAREGIRKDVYCRWIERWERCGPTMVRHKGVRGTCTTAHD